MTKIKFDACPECDLLLSLATPEIGERAHCPRCGYMLQRPRKDSVERTLALSMAGFVLLLPANTLPMVSIKILGNTKDGTMFSGVLGLFNEGFWAVAVLVFLASMLFPFINIVLSLLISAHLHFNWPNKHLGQWMRWLHHIDEWAMLEVYTLGIIVACVKLASIAELKFGFGLYAFVALLIITGMLTSSLDKYLFWQRIEELQS